MRPERGSDMVSGIVGRVQRVAVMLGVLFGGAAAGHVAGCTANAEEPEVTVVACDASGNATYKLPTNDVLTLSQLSAVVEYGDGRITQADKLGAVNGKVTVQCPDGAKVSFFQH
jgi:hypothetical protein